MVRQGPQTLYSDVTDLQKDMAQMRSIGFSSGSEPRKIE